MASRWREWDIDFKDSIIPNGQSVISNQDYPQPKKLDQSDAPPASIPSDLLELIERENASRRRQDCIVVTSSKHGDNYLYTRDGEMQMNDQGYRSEEQEISLHSKPPNQSLDIDDRGVGIGRAQLMKQRVNMVTAGNTQNKPQKKPIGRGRGKSKSNPN